MELTAYVFGDVTLVTRLVSQVVMIFGGGDFNTAVKVAILAGIIAGLFGNLANRGQPNIMTFVWPFIILMVGIMPRVPLVIEDANGGLARIDRVPVLMAAPFSLIGQLGHGLTTMIEDNMGAADTTISMNNGTIVGLRAPLAIAEILTNESAGGAALRLPNGLSLSADAKNYVKGCMTSAMQQNSLNDERIYNQPISLWGQTDYPFPVVGTDGRSRSCQQYYTDIFDQLDTPAFSRSLRAAIDARFARYQGDTTTGTRYEAAVDRLIRDRAGFYRAVVLSHALGKVTADYTIAGSGGSQEVALKDALAQRREASRGKAAMVFETIHQMVGFVEAWTICIMPLMALVMLLGPTGTRLGGKYLWLLVWVQLWFPTILIVMGYLDAQSLNLATRSVTTIAGANAFLENMLKLQDVGYMYLSMATMLSMFLIFGASAVFGTALQSNLDGGEHYDQRKNAPDTLTRQALNVFRPSYEHSNAGGYVGVDAASAFGNQIFSVDYAKSRGTSIEELAQFARSGQRSAAMGTSVGFSGSSGEGVSLGEHAASSETVRHGNSTEFQAGESIGQNSSMGDANGNSHTETDSHQSATAGQVGIQGQGSVGIGAGGTGVGAGVSGSLSRSETNAELTSDTSSRQTNENAGVQQGANVSTGRRSLASQDQSDQSSTTSDKTNDTRSGTTVSQGTTTTRTESEQASTGTSETTSGGSMVSRRTSTGAINGMMWANNIAHSKEGMDELTRMVYQTGIAGEVDRFMGNNAERLDTTFKDDDAKYAFAAQWVMQGLSGGLNRSVDQEIALNALGDYFIDKYSFGLPVVPQGPEGAGIDGLVPSATGVTEAMAANAEAYLGNLTSMHDRIRSAGPNDDVGDLIGSHVAAASREFGSTNKAAIDGLFSSARSGLEARADFHSSEEARGFFGRAADHGLWTAIRTVGMDKDDYQGSVLARAFARDYEPGAMPQDMIDRRLQSFAAEGQANAQGMAAQYMAATQLYLGAEGAGNTAMAADFAGVMRGMEARNPALSGWTGDQIRTFAAEGAMRPEGGIADRLVAAQAAYDFGLQRADLESRLGIEINDTMTADQIRGMLTPSSYAADGAAGQPTTGVLGAGQSMILSFVGGEEAPRGYDQVFGGSRVALSQPLTTMTIGQVLNWQSANRAAGAESGAAGRYQFMPSTLRETAQELGMSYDTVFSPETQDKLAGRLLDKAGYSSFVAGDLPMDVFANRVAGRWAALPAVSGAGAGQSVYHGVGSNRATTSVEAFLSTLEGARAMERGGA